MTASTWIALVVGATIVAGFVFRLLWSLHKLISLGEHIIERVTKLEATLNNGIRGDVRTAKERASEACRLAGVAATTVSRVEQATADNGRATNALRADLDVFTNIVMTDRRRIKQALRDLGHDIDADDDT